jgi:hypothetical protein
MGLSAHGSVHGGGLWSACMARPLLTPRIALLACAAALGLTLGGFAAFPALAIVGGLLFVGVGACLAYDVAGLGDRWISFERSFGAPDLGISSWLRLTLDGAAIACLGIAVAWVSVLAVI